VNCHRELKKGARGGQSAAAPNAQLDPRQSISGTGPECLAGMNERKADPRLVWLASVLAAATLVIFLAHQA
jgi:hypothetical protein